MLITAVCHSTSQLEQRWGKPGAATIWATCGTKILLGAISDPDTLEHASKLCGTAGDGDGKEPVVPPELLRMLPDWRALVIRMNLRPVVVKVRPAWRRLPYRLAATRCPSRACTRRSGDLAACRSGTVPAAANGHGGPGPLARSSRSTAGAARRRGLCRPVGVSRIGRSRASGGSRGPGRSEVSPECRWCRQDDSAWERPGQVRRYPASVRRVDVRGHPARRRHPGT